MSEEKIIYVTYKELEENNFLLPVKGPLGLGNVKYVFTEIPPDKEPFVKGLLWNIMIETKKPD
jgi:hypothetical protein